VRARPAAAGLGSGLVHAANSSSSCRAMNSCEGGAGTKDRGGQGEWEGGEACTKAFGGDEPERLG